MPEPSPDVAGWFATHTHHGAPAPLAELLERARGRRISVVLPARNEAGTIGAIVTAVRNDLVGAGLVDEVLVVDSHSRDATADEARAAGAIVVPTQDVTPGVDDGKGGAMRTGIERMTGDIGIFLDADVRDFGTDFVSGLLTPLLRNPATVLVKAFYDRPWSPDGSSTDASGGGRVTELVARPLIARQAPEIGGFVQPLAGECAFVRSAVLDLPLVSGYGVDVALLLGSVRRYGLDRVAQVDLGRRLHRHQDLQALGRMALQVQAAFDIVLEGVPEVVSERSVLTRTPSGTMRLELQTVSTRSLPRAAPLA